MLRYLIAGALAFAILALPGCGSIQKIIDAGNFATANVSNPVTPDRLNKAEQAMTVVFALGNSWKTLCVQGLAEANCRKNIAAAQVYTRKLPALLTQTRAFVKANDQVNAILVYNQILGLIATFKGQVVAAGVPGAGAL